jgi:hypothetical protein
MGGGGRAAPLPLEVGLLARVGASAFEDGGGLRRVPLGGGDARSAGMAKRKIEPWTEKV